MVRPSFVPARRAVAFVAVLVLVLCGFTAYRVRVDQDRHEARAQAAEQSRHRAAVEQAAADREVARDAARRAQQAAAEQARGLAWSATTTDAAAQVVAAEALLAESEGEVGDDAVRAALAQALDVVRPLLVAPDLAPGDLRAASAAVATALAGLASASLAVAQARTRWQAEQDAAAQAAEQEARAAEQGRARAPAATDPGPGARPSTGAGPDCGGPGSFEPPKDDGSPTFYTSTPSTTGDGTNGKVPAGAMSRLGWCTDSQGNGQWLRSDAAAAMTRLNEAFQAVFGENVAIDLSYRSYADQVAMREYYGSGAAQPGTSNHGLGLAVDTWEWAAYAFGSPRYEWLVTNGPTYGWSSPSWARQGGSNPEYWHFEFVG